MEKKGERNRGESLFIPEQSVARKWNLMARWGDGKKKKT